MPEPKITVLIPTFNRAVYLGECLDSILAQTLAPHQIIVVNDGSSDNTKSVCAAYGKHIDYMESGRQMGKPSAINQGLAKTTGDYVWIFDDDDVALADALRRFVDPLEKNPEYGFSYSTFYFSASRKDNHKIGEVLYEFKIPDLEEKGFLLQLLEANFLCGAGLFARTSCYQKVGLFDPDLLRSQDYEMGIRIARHFKGIRVPGGATFHYRQHTDERGAKRDRFTVDHKMSKWLEYDQVYFAKLYKELPLSTYLLPGNTMENDQRQAILQRIAIMANKLLYPEVVKDLVLLAQINDIKQVTEQEYWIIRVMIVDLPYHRVGDIFDHNTFFDEIRKLAPKSAVIRLLRTKIARAVLARFRRKPVITDIPKLISRLLHLYFKV